jgi:hypothetical protein
VDNDRGFGEDIQGKKLLIRTADGILCAPVAPPITSSSKGGGKAGTFVFSNEIFLTFWIFF